MAAILKVVDEQLGSGKSGRRTGVDLRLASERVSAREIIHSRVVAEVEEINGRKRSSARSYIIQQEPLEQALNAVDTNAPRKGAPLDAEGEIERAIAAFNGRRFVMLLDDRQIDDLDEMVGLRPESEVVFIHLMPLKGG